MQRMSNNKKMENHKMYNLVHFYMLLENYLFPFKHLLAFSFPCVIYFYSVWHVSQCIQKVHKTHKKNITISEYVPWQSEKIFKIRPK